MKENKHEGLSNLARKFLRSIVGKKFTSDDVGSLYFAFYPPHKKGVHLKAKTVKELKDELKKLVEEGYVEETVDGPTRFYCLSVKGKDFCR